MVRLGEAEWREHRVSRPGGLRRAVFVAVLSLAVLVIAELTGAVLWRVTEGSWPGRVAWDAARDRVLRGDNALLEGRRGPDASVDITAEREVLHPYLGYVFNPELNERESRAETGDLLIGDLGFFRGRDETARGEAPPAKLEIGVFGGSVALLFADHDVSRQRLRNAAARATGVEREEIVVRSWALGGYKQPQPLMTLTWLLALGRAPDVVILLDGFNEIALPQSDNLPAGVAPEYPRAWHQRVAGLPDGEELRLLGRLATAVEGRRAAARGAGELPWRRSALASWVWARLDRGRAARISTLRARLTDRQREGLGYRERGAGWTRPSEEIVGELVRLWAESSRQMARLAQANGLVYVHALQPNQYVAGSKPLSAEERELHWTADHPYRPFVERGYPELRRAGEELRSEGIRFVDLVDVFADEERTVYIDDCCHVSQLGSDLLSRPIAGHVQRLLTARARRGDFDKTPGDE